MKKRILTILLIAVTTISLFGCGTTKNDAAIMSLAPSAGSSANSYIADSKNYDDSLVAYSADYDTKEVYEEEIAPASTHATENATNTNRKLIRDVSLHVETKEYDSMIANLEKEIKVLDGYIEYMDVYNGSYNSGKQSRSANLTVRIPAKNLDSFINSVGTEANITNKTESVRDITLTYVDTVSHKNMLVAEEKRLVEMLQQAQTIEEMITVEDRLTEIRYQIDSMESQIRTFDNQVDYSTVSIYVSEVLTYSPVTTEEKTVWERIKEGFSENLTDVVENTKEFFINLIIDLPYIIVSIIKLLIVLFILRLILRSSKKFRDFTDAKHKQYKEHKIAKKNAKLEKKAAKATSKTADSAGTVVSDNSAKSSEENL